MQLLLAKCFFLFSLIKAIHTFSLGIVIIFTFLQALNSIHSIECLDMKLLYFTHVDFVVIQSLMSVIKIIFAIFLRTDTTVTLGNRDKRKTASFPLLL